MKEDIWENNEFLDIYGEFLVAELLGIEYYKAMASESFWNLLNIGARTFAFNTAIKVFLSNKFERDLIQDKDSLLEFVQDDGSYPVEVVQRVLGAAHRARSSFGTDKDLLQRLRNLQIRFGLKQIAPVIRGESYKSLKEESVEYLEDFFKEKSRTNILPTLNTLADEMFTCVLYLVQKGKGISEEEVSLIHDLERFIEALSYFGRFHGEPKVLSLTVLRRRSFPKKNTICQQCCLRPLARKNSQSQCKRYENLACYKKRYKKLRRDDKWVRASLDSNGECKNCGEKTCILEHIHEISGVDYRFCTERCFEAFRKRHQRKG